MRTVALHQKLLQGQEAANLPSIAIFQNNRDILPTMRCKLINWLLEVSLHFRFHRETFFLAIHYLDRYLSLHWGLSRHDLQLLGVASLFVAAKLEEIHPPKIKEFAEVCDGTCAPTLIHSMELDILASVQWRLNFPTVYYWLGSYLDCLRGQHRVRDEAIGPLRLFSLELIDMAVHTPIFVMFPYSMITAAALYIRLQDGKNDLRGSCLLASH